VSIRLMTLVWDIEFPTQSQKLLALKMADYAADTGGSVFPSNETMADKVGCDERTVQRTMKAFRDIGLVTLVRQGGGKPGSTNEWRVNVELVMALACGDAVLIGRDGALSIETTGGKLPGVRGDKTPGNLSGGVTNDARGVTPVSPTPGTSVTQSVTNHQIDSSRADERASVKGARAPSVAAIEIRSGCLAWDAWISHLMDTDQHVAASQAKQVGKMIVSAKFPKDGDRLIEIEGLNEVLKRRRQQAEMERMTGDRE